MQVITIDLREHDFEVSGVRIGPESAASAYQDWQSSADASTLLPCLAQPRAGGVRGALQAVTVSAMMNLMDYDTFRFSTTLDVRWRDLDALAHVNNAVYFTYLEQARVHYLRHLGLIPDEPSGVGIIMAEATCRFLSPLRLSERATVHIRVSEIRNSSFTFEYRVTGADGRLAATARTVQVCYDYQATRPLRMPDDWRETIIASEPALQASIEAIHEQETPS